MPGAERPDEEAREEWGSECRFEKRYTPKPATRSRMVLRQIGAPKPARCDREAGSVRATMLAGDSERVAWLKQSASKAVRALLCFSEFLEVSPLGACTHHLFFLFVT